MNKANLISVLVFVLFCISCSGNKSPEETAGLQEMPTETPAAPPAIQNVSAENAAAMLEKEQGLVVLDIRTPKEYAEGHIQGAKNIDFNADSFKQEIQALDPQKSYLVHCGSGGRSGKSLALFEELGFKSIFHLDSGMNGWKKAELPLEK